MYPILQDCRVRGAGNDLYLHQYKKGHEFILEQIHADILWLCNGENTIEEIAEKFGQPIEDVRSFLQTFEQEGFLTFSQKKSPQKFAGLSTEPYLREVHIDATGWCNLFGQCKHCYGKKKFKESTVGEMTFEEMSVLIGQMGEGNVADCVLSGGEVFMRKDLPDLLVQLAKNHVHVTGIFTNGTIYRQDVIEALQNVGFKTFFFVSLDGCTAEMNDFMRGTGNFDKTVRFIKQVQQAGFPVIINTVVIKQNVKHLMAFCHFVESLGVNRWRLSVPREQGETVINKELIIPAWDDVFKSYETLLRHALVKPGPMKMQIGSIFKSELLEEPVYYLFRPDSNCCEYKRWSIVVKPNGDVTPCTAFDSFVLGNIKTSSLSEIWHRDITQAFKNLPISATECHDCKILEYCGGGCRRIAWELHGSALAKDENSCSLYQFAVDVAKPILEAHGIKAELLEPTPAYPYDPKIIDSAII